MIKIENAQALILFKLAGLIGLIGLISLSAGCATNPVSGKKDFVLMSEAQEIALGKENHQQIIKQYEVYKDPSLQAMVDRVGQKLAAQSHRKHLPFTFTVLDTPEINAFALPGGYIYITRGIMAYLNSEEELAGVLGHEIGHVTARHGVKQNSAQVAQGVVGIAAAILTGNKQVAQAVSTGAAAWAKGYGRNHELAADRLGAEYLARIQYDPESMLKVIGVLKNQELFANERAKVNGEKPSAGYHGVFSSHPDNDERLQEVIRAAKKFQTETPIKIGKHDYLKLTNGMVFGDSEAQGIIQKNNFYHRELNLHLAFPSKWKLINEPDRLVSISPDKAQIIQFVVGDPGAKEPQRYLRKTFPNLSGGQAQGLRAYSGVTALGSPWGKRNGRVAAIKHQDKMFVLLGVGQRRAPNQDFFNTVASIGGLNAREKKLAKGKRLSLVRVARGDTFAKLAQGSNLDQLGVSQLRLLNGLYPSGEPAVGDLVKIVK